MSKADKYENANLERELSEEELKEAGELLSENSDLLSSMQTPEEGIINLYKC